MSTSAAYIDVDAGNIAPEEVHMGRVISGIAATVATLWRADRPLTAVGLIMLGPLAASVAGLWLDPTTISGAPAWLKPAKFAASIAIYSLTLAWIFAYLPEWPKTRRVVGWTTAIVLALELIIIDLQAWRGTTSHFNVGTPLDVVLFSVMGAAIVLQTLTSVAVAVALWRQQFADRALGWALRFGMTLTIVGAFTGGLMTRPTPAQLEGARLAQRMAVAGAHTVGAPDGGPGLPGTGWSREAGDLRVPHFVGLHAVQVLPLVALLLRRRVASTPRRTRLTTVAASSYAALFGILLWQALRAQSIVGPDAVTVVVLATWALATGAAAWVAAGRLPRASSATHVLSAH
jgi:hypothetical protein